jgi:hypothetical protein
MTTDVMKQSTREDMWLSMSEIDLISHATAQKEARENGDVKGSDDLLDKFITMGIPALGKYQSGLLAEAGDIKVCLSIEISKNQEILLHVCNLDEKGGGGGLAQRLTFDGPHASLVLKTFICDFPDAMFITPDFKTLCLFTRVEEQNHKKSSSSSRKMPQNNESNIEGPMSFNTFSRIVVDNIRKPKHIIVAVQK